MIVQPFGFLAAPAGDVEPVAGHYNYFNIGDSSSYPGSGTTVTNIGDNGTQDGTLNGQYTYTSPDKYVGVGDGSPDGNFSKTLEPNLWGSDFTFECGFGLNSGMTVATDQTSFMNVRNVSTYLGINRPGYFFSHRTFALQGVAGYSLDTSVYTAGNNYIIAAVISGTSLKIYINGSLNETQTISSTRPENDPSADTVRYGCFASGTTIPNNNAYPYNFYYWRDYNNKALTDAEVLQNYNANKADLGLS